MKKSVLAALLSLSLVSAASAGTLSVGASPTPHAEILYHVADQLKAEGVELKVVEFTDYVTPNLALNDGDLDANYFQHIPYLDTFCKDRGLDLVAVAGVHIEPMAVYSKKLSKGQAIPDGAVVGIPNDPTNSGRALLLLQSAGLLTLDKNSGLTATELDVEKNPHNFKFRSLEAAQLPRSLDDVDVAVINGNYALGAGLNPVNDALLIEGADSPYVNVLVVKAGNEKNEDIAKLAKALHSDSTAAFIEQKFAGAVLPAFSDLVK